MAVSSSSSTARRRRQRTEVPFPPVFGMPEHNGNYFRIRRAGERQHIVSIPPMFRFRIPPSLGGRSSSPPDPRSRPRVPAENAVRAQEVARINAEIHESRMAAIEEVRDTVRKQHESKWEAEIAAAVLAAPPRTTAATRLQGRACITLKLLEREIGAGPAGRQAALSGLMLQSIVPGGRPDSVVHYGRRAFTGQFSANGDVFFTTVRDETVRIYDTTDPTDWMLAKSTDPGSPRRWLTDASISHDGAWIAFSAAEPVAHFVSVHGPGSQPVRLDLANNTAMTMPTTFEAPGSTRRPRPPDNPLKTPCCVWSLAFSPTLPQLVMGTGRAQLCRFDIATHKTFEVIDAHDGEINTVRFAGPAAPNLFYSGSDDATVRLWDTRTTRAGRPVGVFIGHTEGVTHLDPHSDGRYVLTNGKDQTAKLWDIRKLQSGRAAKEAMEARPRTYSSFDYRDASHEPPIFTQHPADGSVVTYRGHHVRVTLIRCRFSPGATADSAYVSSGSQDGKVYIWRVDGTIARVIDVHDDLTTAHRDDGGYGHQCRAWSLTRADRTSTESPTGWKTIVRDLSWHPDEPILVATAWSGRVSSAGASVRYSWKPEEALERPDLKELADRLSGPARPKSRYSPPVGPDGEEALADQVGDPDGTLMLDEDLDRWRTSREAGVDVTVDFDEDNIDDEGLGPDGYGTGPSMLFRSRGAYSRWSGIALSRRRW